jgi:uncharacterized protein YbgA (DUF1722 family)
MFGTETLFLMRAVPQIMQHLMKVIEAMRHQTLHLPFIIRQIKVYMINHTKIYVEHEGRVNLLFQLLPSGINFFPTLDGKIGGCGIRPCC